MGLVLAGRDNDPLDLPDLAVVRPPDGVPLLGPPAPLLALVEGREELLNLHDPVA